MSSKASLNFRADEIRIDVDLGDTLRARFKVFDADDESSEDLSSYSLESIIEWPNITHAVNWQLSHVGNEIAASLSQEDLENLYALSVGWNYKIWIRKAGERRRVVTGVLVIHL